MCPDIYKFNFATFLKTTKILQNLDFLSKNINFFKFLKQNFINDTFVYH